MVNAPATSGVPEEVAVALSEELNALPCPGAIDQFVAELVLFGALRKAGYTLQPFSPRQKQDKVLI